MAVQAGLWPTVPIMARVIQGFSLWRERIWGHASAYCLIPTGSTIDRHLYAQYVSQHHAYVQ
jgi:hypothetical protein